MYRNIITHLY